jgi:hypothetical protein
MEPKEEERRRTIENAVGIKFESGESTSKLPRSNFFSDIDPTANFLHDLEYMLQYKCVSRVLVPCEATDLEKVVLWKKLHNGKDGGGPESMPWENVELKKELFTVDLFKKINANMSDCDVINRLTFHLFLFGYHNSSNHSILPRDIIFEVFNHLRYFLQPTIVFGMYYFIS